jgi:sodium-dependent phosphate cotransporter
MENLEKQEGPAKGNFFQYAQVFFALLLFIFAIDLLTIGVGNINGGIALEILNATKNPFISLFIGLLVTA